MLLEDPEDDDGEMVDLLYQLMMLLKDHSRTVNFYIYTFVC